MVGFKGVFKSIVQINRYSHKNNASSYKNSLQEEVKPLLAAQANQYCKQTSSSTAHAFSDSRCS